MNIRFLANALFNLMCHASPCEVTHPKGQKPEPRNMIEHVSVRITLPGEGSAVNELPDAFLVQGVRTQEAVRFIVTRCNSLGHPSGEDIEVLIPMTYRDMLEENYDFFRTFASRALTLGVADDLSTNSGSEASY